jgi:macrolide-specific efflux system membrane fusion protein
VSTGTLKQSVAASGTVDATDTEDLSFPASGQVTAVWVKAGQRVAKRARLAAIDSASLAAAVAESRATLATAQAKLAADTASGASSAQRSADAAAITVAQGQVTSATTDLAGATLTAPFAGTVTSVGYVVGQQVGSGSSSSAGAGSGAGTGAGSGSAAGSTSDTATASAGAIHLVSTGSYEIQASVDATDVGLIKAGNQVTITVGDSAQPVFGTVSSVGIVATTTSGVASFPVVVAVTGSPAGVYPGATASLQIVYRQLSDVLLVPTLAVSRAGGAPTVLVQEGTRQVRTTITTGVSSGGQTQVTGGLTEGQQVLVAVPTGTGGGGTTGRTGEFPGGGKFPGRTGGGFGTGGGTGTGGGAAPGGAVPEKGP